VSLADKVNGERQAVTNGTEGCTAAHPDGDLVIACVRIVHLPDDTVHAGLLGETLIQWED
jgi:hypothetical protein